MIQLILALVAFTANDTEVPLQCECQCQHQHMAITSYIIMVTCCYIVCKVCTSAYQLGTQLTNHIVIAGLPLVSLVSMI